MSSDLKDLKVNRDSVPQKFSNLFLFSLKKKSKFHNLLLFFLNLQREAQNFVEGGWVC